VQKDSLSFNSPQSQPEAKKDSTFMTADTLFSQVIPLRDFVHVKLKLGKENDDLEKEYEEPAETDTTQTNIVNRVLSRENSPDSTDTPILTDSLHTKDSLSTQLTDSLKLPVDSIAKDSLKVKPEQKEEDK